MRISLSLSTAYWRSKQTKWTFDALDLGGIWFASLTLFAEIFVLLANYLHFAHCFLNSLLRLMQVKNLLCSGYSRIMDLQITEIETYDEFSRQDRRSKTQLLTVYVLI